MAILPAAEVTFDAEIPIIIIGAGACGLVAALAAKGAGGGVVVLERDPVPQGSTALSSGLIPAAETKTQRDQGLKDSAMQMATDIIKKAHHENDPSMVETVCRQSAVSVDWLNDIHGLNLTVIESFLYPGHSAHRMHGTPSKTGQELIGALVRRTEALDIPVITNALVTDLYVDNDGDICGVRFNRPDGSIETMGCKALILACNGYGGNPDMVAEFIPDMKNALYFGHTGNQGDAIAWGLELGACLDDLGAYQGHGSVAYPHGILLTWAVMMEGGIQINAEGKRFSNEHDGYSEQARRVIAQPDGIAWSIYDQRLHDFALDFDDYRQAEAAGAVRRADTVEALSAICRVPAANLMETVTSVQDLADAGGQDEFGRTFVKDRLAPPYYVVRVTGALFHTQGGLIVDARARVLTAQGGPFTNLFAGGGAARGLSGPSDWGYLSGNGLLTAVTLGHIAGEQAASLVAREIEHEPGRAD